MSKIKLTLDNVIVTGKQVSFKAPCNSGDVTCLNINNVDYDIVDANGNLFKNIEDIWSDGAMVSAILDTTTHKAYIQNMSNVISSAWGAPTSINATLTHKYKGMVRGYYKSADKKFYDSRDFSHQIAGDAFHLYVDMSNDYGDVYYYSSPIFKRCYESAIFGNNNYGINVFTTSSDLTGILKKGMVICFDALDEWLAPASWAFMIKDVTSAEITVWTKIPIGTGSKRSTLTWFNNLTNINNVIVYHGTAECPTLVGRSVSNTGYIECYSDEFIRGIYKMNLCGYNDTIDVTDGIGSMYTSFDDPQYDMNKYIPMIEDGNISVIDTDNNDNLIVSSHYSDPYLLIHIMSPQSVRINSSSQAYVFVSYGGHLSPDGKILWE